MKKINDKLIEKTIKYITGIFENNADGHDLNHSIRVYNTALKIAESCEGADLIVVSLSALLHDVDDHKLFDSTNNENARHFLEDSNVPSETIEKICQVINSVSFSKNKGKKPDTIEGCIVQDADRLDALGAVGVARTFAYGGKHGRSLEESRKHFDEKLLLLKDQMNTDAGKKMAEERHKFLVSYVGELDKEMINGRYLEGKVAIVTGANSGMGMATTAALSDLGARVIMLCRSEERGKKALSELMKKEGRSLELIICDLGDYDSIRNFVRQVKNEYERIDILVNNAGFISLDRQETKEGLERQFGINHIGHFLLTELLLCRMGKGSRIVIVASGAHKTGRIHFEDINLTRSFNVIKAYSQSKLANVLYTRELARRTRKRGITVNCCHPGAVATNIGIDRDTGFGKTITGLLKPFFQTTEEGARTAIFLATDDSVSDISGEYFYKCKIAKSSKRSKDIRLARKLSVFSKEIINK